jgi:hypothetical protein
VWLAQQDNLNVIGPGAPPSEAMLTTADIPPFAAGGHNWAINVTCIAPEQAPVAFTATLLVSWASGSIQVPLSGTTSQIVAKVTTPEPIKFFAGVGASVDLELQYFSLDATALAVKISPVQFPQGLDFTPVTVTMPPKYIQSGQNPKNPTQGPSGPFPLQLGQRFLGSNHIRQPQRVCKTRCGRPGGD